MAKKQQPKKPAKAKPKTRAHVNPMMQPDGTYRTDVGAILGEWHERVNDMLTCGDDQKWLAATLLIAADTHGINPSAVKDFPELMKKYGLSPEEITPSIIAAAAHLDRQHTLGTQRAVDHINKLSGLLALQKAWQASGLPTIEAYLARYHPAKIEAPTAQVVSSPIPDAGTPPARATAKETGSGRAKIYGHPVTAVIRWMGSEHWTREMAAKALKALKVEAAEGTIRIQLDRGRKGIGDIAPMDDQSANDIYEKI